jgi:UDP-3-O-[3-hydroxymyristoyl] glucosamine N-acyltransferase
MISMLNQHKHSYFEIKQLFNQDTFYSCRKTSFVWSKSPFTLCLAVNRYYFDLAVNNPNITGIVATPQAAFNAKSDIKAGVVITEKADELFYYLHNKEFHLLTDNREGSKQNKNNDKVFIDPSANIDRTAVLGENVWIGENVIIHPGCVILDNCTIKRDSVLHPNVTVGTEGFFSKYVMGEKIHIRHFGGVEIGENCIVHTGTNISKSVNYQENTTISNNVHIGIQSNIGHDCHVGFNSDISAKVLLAGRVRVGQNCWIGAGVTIANALAIGDNSKIMIGSVVITDVPENATVSGNFALDHSAQLRQYMEKKRI